MKTLSSLILLCSAMLALSASAGVTKIVCTDNIGPEDGDTIAPFTFTKGDDGQWSDGFFEIGQDTSSDPNVINVDTLGLIECKGTKMNYNVTTHTLNYEQKNRESFMNGGGCTKDGPLTYTHCTAS